MRVCILTETYYPVVGGGETQARLLAEGLTASGNSVVLLTRRSDASFKKVERYGTILVYRLAPVGRGQLKKWGLLLSSFPALINLRNQYDLVFVSGYRILGISAVLVGKLLRKPVVLKADSQGEMSGEFFQSGLRTFGLSPTSLLFRLFLRWRNSILKKAQAFTAIVPEFALEWASSGIPPDKIHLIPNSVDTERFIPVDDAHKLELRQKLNLPPGATLALYTGRLVSYKGLPLLLKVWKEVCCHYRNALLLLAGTGGLDIHNCEEELREYVKNTGLEQNVLFLGAVQNIPEYLQGADFFVFPTENDAFPSSVVEAMACGLPVVATPVGAIGTIIKDEENGLLVQPGDFQQLLDALKRVMSDRLKAYRMGQAARRVAEERYSAKRINEMYVSLFQELLKADRL